MKSNYELVQSVAQGLHRYASNSDIATQDGVEDYAGDLIILAGRLGLSSMEIYQAIGYLY